MTKLSVDPIEELIAFASQIDACMVPPLSWHSNAND